MITSLRRDIRTTGDALDKIGHGGPVIVKPALVYPLAAPCDGVLIYRPRASLKSGFQNAPSPSQ
jgi:hypothetical protein